MKINDLLKQMINDAKSVKLLGLAWNEGRFYGVMGYDDKGNVVRISCHCIDCNRKIELETSSSHICQNT